MGQASGLSLSSCWSETAWGVFGNSAQGSGKKMHFGRFWLLLSKHRCGNKKTDGGDSISNISEPLSTSRMCTAMRSWMFHTSWHWNIIFFINGIVLNDLKKFRAFSNIKQRSQTSFNPLYWKPERVSHWIQLSCPFPRALGQIKVKIWFIYSLSIRPNGCAISECRMQYNKCLCVHKHVFVM